MPALAALAAFCSAFFAVGLLPAFSCESRVHNVGPNHRCRGLNVPHIQIKHGYRLKMNSPLQNYMCTRFWARLRPTCCLVSFGLRPASSASFFLSLLLFGGMFLSCKNEKVVCQLAS